MSKFDSDPRNFKWFAPNSDPGKSPDQDFDPTKTIFFPQKPLTPQEEERERLRKQAAERRRRIKDSIHDWASPESNVPFHFETAEVGYATLPKYGRVGQNGDRVLIVTTRNQNKQERICVAGVDGMGGHADPSFAAQTLGESIAESVIDTEDSSVEIDTFKKAQENASTAMKKNPGNAGAVYAAVVIENRHLKAYQAGDCRMLVIRNGGLIKATRDEGYFNVLGNSVTAYDQGSTTAALDMDLQPGDIVLILTDGVTDNIGERYLDLVEDRMNNQRLTVDTEKVNEKLAQMTSKHNVKEIVQAIGKLVEVNMVESGRKPDDFGIAAIQIK